MDLNALRNAARFDWIGIDHAGFLQQGAPTSRVPWADVLKIALVFVPDPYADEDFFWAIRSSHGITLVSTENPIFDAALRARFRVVDAPAPAEWTDTHEPRSYVVWPESERGQALGG